MVGRITEHHGILSLSKGFQVLNPLDFVAEFTQHIPPKGSHLVRWQPGFAGGVQIPLSWIPGYQMRTPGYRRGAAKPNLGVLTIGAGGRPHFRRGHRPGGFSVI
jgi:hypothetical protein